MRLNILYSYIDQAFFSHSLNNLKSIIGEMDQHLQRLMPIKCIFISGNCWAATGFLDVRRIKIVYGARNLFYKELRYKEHLWNQHFISRDLIFKTYFDISVFFVPKKSQKYAPLTSPIWLIKGTKKFHKGKRLFRIFS